MNRGHVTERLTYLRNMEGFAAVALPALLVGFLTQTEADWSLPVAAVAIVSVILLQGTFYWHLKLHSVRTRCARLPGYFWRTFALLRFVNLVLLGGFVLLSAALSGRSDADSGWTAVSWGLFGLAVLEHVNYYHYQLMHDNVRDISYLWRHRRIRRSPLALDLMAARAAALPRAR